MSRVLYYYFEQLFLPAMCRGLPRYLDSELFVLLCSYRHSQVKLAIGEPRIISQTQDFSAILLLNTSGGG